MPQALLGIVQSFARRQGLPIPSFVVGNPDAQVAQFQGILEEFCDDLLTRGLWEVSTWEASFVSTAQESQGLMTTIAPFGYRGMVPRTFFDRTQRLEIPIAISAQEWQMRKTLGIAGPLYQARVRQGELLFIPPPTAGHTMVFEYYSDHFVMSTDAAGNAIGLKYPAKDTDTFKVDDSIAIAYLRWAWKSQKGLDYGEEFRKYEVMVGQELSRTRVSQRATLDSYALDARPGIVVPPGSWNISNGS